MGEHGDRGNPAARGSASPAERQALQRVDHAGRDLDRRGPGRRRHQRRPRFPDRCQEVVVLAGDRVGIGDGDRFGGEHVGEEPVLERPPVGGWKRGGDKRARTDAIGGRDHLDGLGCEIAVHHRFGRPERYGPPGGRADPRGGEISDEARRKHQPRPCGILEAAGRHDPLGFDPFKPAGIERQHEVDIVNHEVMDHAHVERAEREGGGPHRLDDHRLTDPCNRGLPGGIEPLHVADGDRATAAAGGDHDCPGIFNGRRDRLFHEQVHASLEQRHGHAGMQAGWGGDDGGIDEPHQFAGLGAGPAAVGRRDSLPRLAQRIDHGHEFDIGASGQEPRMDRPEMTAADDCHPHPIHAALLRSRARPCRPCCCRSRNSRSSSTGGGSMPCDRRISRACSTPTLAR